MPASRPTSSPNPAVRSLKRRDRRPELMDDPAISERDHDSALRGLARLNRASRIERTVLMALKPYLKHRPSDQPLRVLDVAAGSGDLVAALAQLTANTGLPVHFTGCDISEHACQRIKDRAATLPESIASRIDALRCDVIHDRIPQGYDIVMCHLFLHHLDEPDIVRLLRAMRESAGSAVIITDLRRTRRGLMLAWLASRLLTRCRVVHTDALLSVRGALSIDELRAMAISAGYDEHCICGVWPQRIQLAWRA